MKIGYPCINRSIGCTANGTFRLSSYSEQKMIEIIRNNLLCLKKTLQWNLEHGLLFFRIGSSLIPFASHPICTFDWQQYFQEDLQQIGNFIKQHKMRISTHPDQFVLINAQDISIVEKSIAELKYHAELLNLLGLAKDAKIQIHVGGVYNDKNAAKERFIKQYKPLSESIKARLVIEHDHNRFSFQDCFEIYQQTGIPIIVDILHHELLNNSESIQTIMQNAATTWQTHDGIPMIDYSSQKVGGIKGAHAESIDKTHFLHFLEQVQDFDFDCMLEIKDKEKSALEAIKLINLQKNSTVKVQQL